MRDFIFLIGASGVGKSTLCKGLFEHYKTAYFEQSHAPEFIAFDGNDEINGLMEEEICWQWAVSTLRCYHKLGFRNIICSDFDDLRTRDIPEIFKGKNFITIKLVCSEYAQNKEQMINRKNGLIDVDLLEKSFSKINNRLPLVNEFEIDVSGKSADEVLAQAIKLVDSAEVLLDYEYTKPAKDNFYSWVWANGLR